MDYVHRYGPVAVLILTFCWGAVYAVALFEPSLEPPAWVSATLALVVGGTFVLAANTHTGKWAVIAIIFSMVLSGGELVAIYRQSRNSQKIEALDAAFLRGAVQQCKRVQDLRDRFNYDTRVVHDAFLLIAADWQTTPTLRHSTTALQKMARTLGIEARVNCHNPDGIPAFLPLPG